MLRREYPFALADAGGVNPTTVVFQPGLIAAPTTIVLHVGCIGQRSHGSAKRKAPRKLGGAGTYDSVSTTGMMFDSLEPGCVDAQLRQTPSSTPSCGALTELIAGYASSALFPKAETSARRSAPRRVASRRNGRPRGSRTPNLCGRRTSSWLPGPVICLFPRSGDCALNVEVAHLPGGEVGHCRAVGSSC
jgi:hypothetical protein